MYVLCEHGTLDVLKDIQPQYCHHTIILQHVVLVHQSSATRFISTLFLQWHQRQPYILPQNSTWTPQPIAVDSIRHDQNQEIWFATALCSATVLDLDTVACFAGLHETRLEPRNMKKKTYVDLLSSRHQAQFASENALIKRDFDLQIFSSILGHCFFSVLSTSKFSSQQPNDSRSM